MADVKTRSSALGAAAAAASLGAALPGDPRSGMRPMQNAPSYCDTKLTITWSKTLMDPDTACACADDLIDAASNLSRMASKGDNKAVKELLLLLRTAPAESRCLAASALGAAAVTESCRVRPASSCRGEAAEALLESASEDESIEVRCACLSALQSCAVSLDTATVRQLAECAEDESPLVRQTALLVLAKRAPQGDQLTRLLLLQVLDEGDEAAVEAVALEGLVRHGAPGDHELLQAVLRVLAESDESPGAAAAAAASGHIAASADGTVEGGAAATAAVAAAAAAAAQRRRTDADAALVQRAALQALGHLAPAGSIGPQERLFLIDAVANFAATTGEPGSEALVRQTRLAALAALSQLGGVEDPDVRKILLALADDEDADVRWASISWLGSKCQRGDAELLSRLLECVGDPNPHVRRVLACTISQVSTFGDERCMRALAPGLEDPDPEVRSSTVEALEKLVPVASDRAKLALYRQHYAVSGEAQRLGEQTRQSQRLRLQRRAEAREAATRAAMADAVADSAAAGIKAGVAAAAAAEAASEQR